MSEYKKLLRTILDEGVRKSDRTGVGTISMFGYQQRFDLREGFPIVTEKKTAFKMAITEMIWMIGGWMKDPAYEGYQSTNIKFLLDNNCHIWTEWPYKAYVEEELAELNKWQKLNPDILIDFQATSMDLFEYKIQNDKEFALKYGDLGPVYQKQMRNFEGKSKAIDQLKAMLVKLRSNPDDRRNIVSFWNPTEMDDMKLPPCWVMFQVWTRELTIYERADLKKPPHDTLYNLDVDPHDLVHQDFDKLNIPRKAVSLQMYQRSSDCFLGIPFDWVWFSAFTHVLAEMTAMVPGDFIWTSGDTHLYLNSLEAVETVLSRESYEKPRLIIKRKVEDIEDYRIDDFELDNYISHPHIKVAVAV